MPMDIIGISSGRDLLPQLTVMNFNWDQALTIDHAVQDADVSCVQSGLVVFVQSGKTPPGVCLGCPDTF